MTDLIVPVDRGDRRNVRVTFTDELGAVADPTVVTLRVHRPDPAADLVYVYDGTGQFQLTKVSAGVYEKQVTFDVSGRWSIRGEAAGAVVAATSPIDVDVLDDPF